MGSQGTSFTHEQYRSLSSSRQLNGIACAGKAKMMLITLNGLLKTLNNYGTGSYPPDFLGGSGKFFYSKPTAF